MDTHALSEPAFASALEVLAANGVETMIDAHGGYTPTPVISPRDPDLQRGRKTGLADGIVISPSHNPPDEGGFKYNPANGGPADIDVTGWIENAANDFLAKKLDGVQRIPYERARNAACIHAYDYITPYVTDLANVVDHGCDPRGGREDRNRSAGWRRGPLLAADHRALQDRGNRGERRRRSDIPLHDRRLGRKDPDGLLLALCDGAADRACATNSISPSPTTPMPTATASCPSSGLMNPNHYLAAAISYLYVNGREWRGDSGVGNWGFPKINIKLA